MSVPRAPMTPPRLTGYEHVRLLGTGGYSDVFLYEQQMPKRPVAVKVLIAEGVSDVDRRRFIEEANTMAAVSTHPYIVTIFHAGVSEDGHPHLVMEYYPQPNYSVRARTEKVPIAEVLRTGIQVASAVETAHRAGILHRDIKPANILTSDYGRPGLTDFGIAGNAGDGTEAVGMSIPWSPPEITGGQGASGTAADVYSLGATLYTLLAGRSPFEEPGGRNSTLDLLGRIERGDPPPTGRPDSPASLERLLRQSMAKNPADRHSSAAELARALQAIEVERQLAVTPLEVREDRQHVRPRAGGDDEDGTRLKAPVIIESQQPPVASAPRGTLIDGTPHGGTLRTHGGDPPATPIEGATVQRAPGSPGLIAGVGSRPAYGGGLGSVAPVPNASPSGAPGTPRTATDNVAVRPAGAVRAPRQRLLVGASAVVAVVMVLGLVRVVVGAGSERGRERPTSATSILDLDVGLVRPTNVSVQPLDDGGARVTWSLPDIPAGVTIDLVGVDELLDDDMLGATVPAPAQLDECPRLEMTYPDGKRVRGEC